MSSTLSGGRPISFLFPRYYTTLGASQVPLVAKNLPANEEDIRDEGSIPGLGRFPLEEGMATHSSILAWRNPWTEEPMSIESVVHTVA